MISDDEVLALYERADSARWQSAPPMVDAAEYLTALTLRSHDMTLIDTTETPITPPDRRWLRFGVAAAATVLVVAGGAYLMRSEGRDEVPSMQPTTVQHTPTTEVDDGPGGAGVSTPDAAITVVQQFYDALNAYDAERVNSMTDLPDEDDRHLSLDFDRATGFIAHLGDCAANARADSEFVVRCWYDYEFFHSRELGYQPFTGNTVEIVISDGTIVSISEDSNWVPLSEGIFDPMAAWMQASHPDDVAVLYELEDGEPSAPNISVESIPLWEQRAREYVDIRLGVERTATAFLDAFTAFDADAAAIYLAEGASTERMVTGNVAGYAQAIGLYSAMGYRQHLDACRHVTASVSVHQVRCELAYELMGSGQLGFEPFDRSFVTVTVDQQSGSITEVIGSWAVAEYLRDVGEPFATWLESNHPDDAAVMSVDGNPSLTPESLTLWRRHRIDYVQQMMSESATPTTEA